MSISYIKGTESKEEFLEKKFKKTGSESTKLNLIAHIRKFEQYCEYGLKRESELVIQDLVKDWTKTKDVSNLVNLLNQYHQWIQEDHPDVIWYNKRLPDRKYTFSAVSPNAQKTNLGIIRLYLRARTGVRISAEDMSEKITIPVDQNEREEYPLTLEQFQQIYDKTTILRRKVKYLFMRDTGCRTIESIQITKKMIEFGYDKTGIARVKMPKKIVKGKTKSRINFLTPETAKMVKQLSENLDENSPIFVDLNGTSNFMMRKAIEVHAFWNTRETLVKEGFSEFAEKHESGTRKILLHSIRAFTATAYSKGNSNNESLGHGYIGHKKYLDQYIRRSEAEQLEMFKNAIPLLTGITKEYGESELSQQVKELKNQINLIQRQNTELKKTGQKAVQAKSDQSAKWKFVVDELLKLEIVSQTDILEILERAPKVVISKE